MSMHANGGLPTWAGMGMDMGGTGEEPGSTLQGSHHGQPIWRPSPGEAGGTEGAGAGAAASAGTEAAAGGAGAGDLIALAAL